MVSESVSRLLIDFQRGQSNFDGSFIKEANLQTQFLPFISFRKAYLPVADFRHSILPGANFEAAILYRANFEQANLLAADLRSSDLTQANLSHGLLAGSSLVEADLSGANLSGACLSHADLSSANLRNANLLGANLKGVNLSQANLFGARIDLHALISAILSSTMMPNGEVQTRSPTSAGGPVPVANMISCTRIASSLVNQRPPKLTSQKSECTEVRAMTPDNVVKFKPDAVRRHVWFQFTERSGDLDLSIINPPMESG